MINRRSFLKTAGAGVLASLAGGYNAFAETKKLPNILLILIDDLGYSDVACFGSETYRTPNIDRLCSEGLKFTDAYAACPVCSPTRASILTGKYPARLHLTDWIPGHKHPFEKLAIPDWTQNLPQDEITIGKAMKDLGYATAWIGKWHQGEKAEPKKMGFDAGGEDWSINRIMDDNDPKGTNTLTNMCQEFIDTRGDKPFFVALSHYTVHAPVYGSSKLKAKYEILIDKEQPKYQTKANYAAMVGDMDKSVGNMLKWLEEKGLSDTIVIFFSDNGGLVGPTENYPLRAGKGTMYEGGIRVPLVIKWPGVVKPGAKTDQVVTSCDLYPTILSIAGCKDTPVPVDGVDLSSLIKDGKPLNREAIYWHYPHYHKSKPASAVRKGDYKLIEYLEDGLFELYNLRDDLAEQKDLANKEPEKVRELYQDLCNWRKSVGAQMMEQNPKYDPKKAKKENVSL